MAELGIDSTGHTVHALRHTAATRFIRAGVPLPEVQRLLGWSSLAMFSRYYGDGAANNTAADQLDLYLEARRGS